MKPFALPFLVCLVLIFLSAIADRSEAQSVVDSAPSEKRIPLLDLQTLQDKVLEDDAFQPEVLQGKVFQPEVFQDKAFQPEVFDIDHVSTKLLITELFLDERLAAELIPYESFPYESLADLSPQDLEPPSLEVQFPTTRFPVVKFSDITSLSIRIQENDQFAIITIPADSLFRFDQDVIRPNAEDLLRQISQAIATRYPNSPLKIQAHTDSLGADDYNQSLSVRRAASIRQWLSQQDKLKWLQMTHQGYGDSEPITLETNPDQSDNPLGRQKNRRIEIVIQKQPDLGSQSTHNESSSPASTDFQSSLDQAASESSTDVNVNSASVSSQSIASNTSGTLEEAALEVEFPKNLFPVVRFPEITSLNVGIQENDQLAIITIPVDTLFEFNRALIQPDAEVLLRQISRAIATRYPNPILKIQAHTDSIGTASYNLSLSERQAEAIKQWLYRQNKIDLSKLSSQGYGATQPVALETNIDRSDNPLGRQRNRRIEIIIQK